MKLLQRRVKNHVFYAKWWLLTADSFKCKFPSGVDKLPWEIISNIENINAIASLMLSACFLTEKSNLKKKN